MIPVWKDDVVCGWGDSGGSGWKGGSALWGVGVLNPSWLQTFYNFGSTCLETLILQNFGFFAGHNIPEYEKIECFVSKNLITFQVKQNTSLNRYLMRDLTKSLGGRRMNELGKLIPAYLQAASGIRWFYTYAVPACDLQAKKNCIVVTLLVLNIVGTYFCAP